MVDISNKNNTVRVNVSDGNENSSISITNSLAKYYEELAKEHEENAKQSEENAQVWAETAENIISTGVDEIEEAKENVIKELDTYVEEHHEALKGEKGDKGDIGPIGPIGPQGPKGDKGEPGSVDNIQFIDLQGSPYDNTNLKNALDSKQDVITDLGDIRNNIATNTSNISAHTSNGTIHVTASDKIAWSQKQNTSDNALTTTDKTIVGAINELNAKPAGLPTYIEATETLRFGE